MKSGTKKKEYEQRKKLQAKEIKTKTNDEKENGQNVN